VNRLRLKLLGLFLAATLFPLGVTLWIMSSLLDTSLGYAPTTQLDELSRSLETTGREFYQRTRDAMKTGAAQGLPPNGRYHLAGRSGWPPSVAEFWNSGEAERFELSGAEGDQLVYLLRDADGVRLYSRDLGRVGMGRIARQFSRARQTIDVARARNLKRGFTVTLIVAGAAVWLVSLAVMLLLTWRISRPLHRLAGGLRRLANGDLAVRLPLDGDEDAGGTLSAFNDTAERLERSREREAWTERLAGSQALARKMAHEIKNSLTPIRLTMEEVLARRGSGDDRQFFEQAAAIVAEEVAALERRVRAFTEFSSEPPVHPESVDLNALAGERVTLLGSVHPDVRFDMVLADPPPKAFADPDLVRGILTNLLNNAAEAAGRQGVVKLRTSRAGESASLEIQDSGPGLSPEAARNIFEPAISFKKGGMGLGLSIARRSALLCGGDILLVKGDMGGAAFRLSLPVHHAV
jgi:nitrogen fixation/metabolism regulation signal transduction histidine kinase